jgi:hypothetical protein
MTQELKELLNDFGPEVQQLARSAREQILKLVPDTQEKVMKGYKAISFHFGGAMKDQFASLVLHKAHVNLQFTRGVDLPDPANLLEGTGKLMRHVKLRQPETIQQDEVQRLIKTAAAQARG